MQRKNDKLKQFPSVAEIVSGCSLRSVCYAVLSIHGNELIHESSWDGNTYRLQDSCGSRGVISFVPRGNLFAAFFCEDSDRNPYRHTIEPSFIYEMADPPAPLKILKKQTCQYMLDEYDSETFAILTSAFWGLNHSVESFESWSSLKNHAGPLLTDLFSTETQKLADDFGFSSQEVDLVIKIHRSISQKSEVQNFDDEIKKVAEERKANDYSECLKQIEDLKQAINSLL